MADNLKDFTVQGPDGHTYTVTASPDATDDELIGFVQQNLSQQPQEPAQKTPQVTLEQGQASVPATPPTPVDDRVTIAHQGLGAHDDFRFAPSVQSEIDAAAANPNMSPERVNALVKQRQTEAGQPALGLAGDYATQLGAYRESLKKGNSQQSLGYSELQLPTPGVHSSLIPDKATPLPGVGGTQSQILTWLTRAFQEASANPDTFGGLVSRNWNQMEYGDQAKELLRKQYPGLTEDQYSSLANTWISQIQERMASANAEDIAKDPLLTRFAGGAAGAAGPEYLIPGFGGEGVASRVAASGAINAGANAAYQGAAVAQGAQQEFDPLAVAEQGAMGAAFHAGMEGVSHVISSLKPRVDVNTGEPVVPQRISVPTAKRNTKAFSGQLDATRQDIADHINNVVGDWKNAPEFEVHPNFKNLDGVENDAVGAYGPDGKIYVNAEKVIQDAKKAKVDPETVVNAMVYHEALGHHGLAQKFGDDLESTLTDFYDNGVQTFRDRVDKWMEDNPEAYKDAPNRVALASEEVLAELSEKGRLPVTLKDRLSNLVKDLGRKMGLNLKYSDREIRTILGMAHNATINGVGRDVAGNGFKFMQTGARGHQSADERGFYKSPEPLEEAVTRAEAGEPFGPGSQIHKDTGWFLGPDRRWRTEIDDSVARLRHVDASGVEDIARHSGVPLHEVSTELKNERVLDLMANPHVKRKYNISHVTLESVLDHPALFELYPELKDVAISRESGSFGEQGSFHPGDNSINISPRAKDPYKTLIHEIQHWVQEKEGFSTGGTTTSALKRVPDKRLQQISKRVSQYYLKEADNNNIAYQAFMSAYNDPLFHNFSLMYERWKKTMRLPADDPKAMEAYRNMNAAEQKILDKYFEGKRYTQLSRQDQYELHELLYNTKNGGRSGLLQGALEYKKLRDANFNTGKRLEHAHDNPDILRRLLRQDQYLPFQAYEHLFGEVEARDTANRLSMTAEERKATTPYTSEDHINPADYIFDRGLGPTEQAASDVSDIREAGQKREIAKGLDEVLRFKDHVQTGLSDMLRGKYDLTPKEYVEVVKDSKIISDEIKHWETAYRHVDAEKQAKIQTILDHAYDAQRIVDHQEAIFPLKSKLDGEQLVPQNDNNKYMREYKPGEEAAIESAKEIISGALDHYTPRISTWAEGKRAARDRGLTAKQIRSAKGITDLDKKLFQYDEALYKTNNQLAALLEKRDRGEWTPADKAKFLETAYTFNEASARVFSDHAEIARALNALKTIYFSKNKLSQLREILGQAHDSSISAFADEDTFDKFADQIKYLLSTNNPAGTGAALRAITKPYWWEYLLSFRHSMMLSGLGTHAKNAKDNALMIARELEESIIAAPGFAVRKGINALGGNVEEGVSPQEIAGRLYGILRAALDVNTYKDSIEAFLRGHPNRAINPKIELADARIPIVSKVSDALYAADTLFRAIHMNANLYSLGVRRAREEGFKGLAAFEEGSNYAANPSEKMLKEARGLTDLALLLDTPSSFSAKLESVKAIRPNMRPGDQATAFAANLLFPFFRVTDRLLFQKLRRSPFAFMDKNTRADIAAGGPRMDIAIARMIYGSALIYYYWEVAGQGKETGNAPTDPKKLAALQAGGYQKNSVLKDGKYVDATALNLSLSPTDTQNSVAANVASLREAWDKAMKNGANEDEKKRIADGVGMSFLALGSILSSNSFANNLQTYTEPFTQNDDATATTAGANLTSNLLGQWLPAAMRQYNQTYGDTTRRDTTGDKSFGDRVKGRLMADIPGQSEKLPPKYDLYGEPMQQGRSLSGMSNYQTVKTDAVSRELQRLERTTDKPVVTGAPSSFELTGVKEGVFNPKYVASTDDDRVKLTAAGKEEWQRIQGYYLREGMSRVIRMDAWKRASDKQRIDLVKQLKSDASEATKQHMASLFGLQPREGYGEDDNNGD